jgi:hypothetical protein
MKGSYSALRPRHPWPWVLVALSLTLSLGCQKAEPPLSAGAQEFKKEVKDCIKKLSTPLQEPLSRRDIPAINETLKKVEPEAIKLCRMCPFRIGVLDQEGNTLTVYPQKEGAVDDFSNYDLIVQTLKNRRTGQRRFFLQDGTQIYIICVPLFKGDRVQGLLALAVSSEEARKRWQMSSEEFLAIDFDH